MDKTSFAGITRLDPDDSLFEDGGAFLDRDRLIIDRYLRLGAKDHRHMGLSGLLDPDIEMGASGVGSGGQIPAGVEFSVGYTLENDDGGETLLSPTVIAATPSPIQMPTIDADVEIDYTAGELTTDTYYYAYSYTDGQGGETPVSPVAGVEREPGFANAQVLITGLHGNGEFSLVGAAGWRLYRAVGGGELHFLAEGDTDDYTDDGTVSCDCDITPLPTGTNTTNGDNSIVFELPPDSNDRVASATFINLYASPDGSFDGDVLVDQYPLASAGEAVIYSEIDFLPGSPPDVNTAIGSPNQIDPDTEILDWHWKRPQADEAALLGTDGEEGDVRVTLDTGDAWVYHDGAWNRLVSGLEFVEDGSGGSAAFPNALRVLGSGGTSVEVADDAGVAEVRVSSPLPGEIQVVGASGDAEFGSGWQEANPLEAHGSAAATREVSAGILEVGGHSSGTADGWDGEVLPFAVGSRTLTEEEQISLVFTPQSAFASRIEGVLGSGLLYLLAPSDVDTLEDLSTYARGSAVLEGSASLVEPGILRNGAGADLDGAGDYLRTRWGIPEATIEEEDLRDVAFAPSGERAYISNSSANEISEIDTATGTIIDVIASSDQPFGLAVAPDGELLFAANAGGDYVSVIDLATKSAVATITVGDNPLHIIVTPNGEKIYVVNNSSDNVSVIDVASNSVSATITVGDSPRGIDVTPDGSQVYVVNQHTEDVSVIDTATESVVDTIAVGSNPWDIAITPDGVEALAVNVFGHDASIIDIASGSVVDTMPAGLQPIRIVIEPDGVQAFTTSNFDDKVSVLDIARRVVVATFPVGGAFNGMAVSPDGEQLYGAMFSDPSSVHCFDIDGPLPLARPRSYIGYARRETTGSINTLFGGSDGVVRLQAAASSDDVTLTWDGGSTTATWPDALSGLGTGAFFFCLNVDGDEAELFVSSADATVAPNFYKNAGRVYLGGRVSRIGGSESKIFSLPSGYRPPGGGENFVTWAGGDSGGVGRVRVRDNGAVEHLNGDVVEVSLSGISFREAGS